MAKGSLPWPDPPTLQEAEERAPSADSSAGTEGNAQMDKKLWVSHQPVAFIAGGMRLLGGSQRSYLWKRIPARGCAVQEGSQRLSNK